MDKYSIVARIYPMILFYLPLNVIMIVIVWDFQDYFHYAIPVGFVGIIGYLTSHLGRDAGKTKEAKLWSDWGGAPTTQLFRWSDQKIDLFTKRRSHIKMEQLCPIGNIIDENYEVNNSLLADQVYKSWTVYLLGKTRDTTKFSLIFKENIAYGFRRNLWGLKTYSICLILLLMIATFCYFGYTLGIWKIEFMPKIFFVSEIYLSFFLLFWILRVTENWVKLVAFSYAERLHESIELL